MLPHPPPTPSPIMLTAVIARKMVVMEFVTETLMVKVFYWTGVGTIVPGAPDVKLNISSGPNALPNFHNLR